MATQTARDVSYSEEFIWNPRGVKLFTCSWTPYPGPSKALVFLCHGYGMECSVSMKETGTRLAKAGYAVYGIDYEGHGKSQGRRCYIKKFSNIVEDCYDFFTGVCRGRKEYETSLRFLYGESMGGAVALLLHRRDPSFWSGAVLVAPMCKISEKIKPHPVVVKVLTQLEVIIPRWKIVPAEDVIEAAFKDPVKRQAVRSNKLIYQDKPRLRTALEMLRTSMELADHLNEIKLPFLVLHGEDDTVTDPAVSEALYKEASSTDKTFNKYRGLWHALTSGESDGDIDRVFTDILDWLDRRLNSLPLPVQNSDNCLIHSSL